MSEHIRQGKEIVQEWIDSDNKINEYKGKTFSEKWVSVSWLKKQLENKVGFLWVGCANKEDKITQLQWVLSLLEEK